jgi:hypothetical protein
MAGLGSISRSAGPRVRACLWQGPSKNALTPTGILVFAWNLPSWLVRILPFPPTRQVIPQQTCSRLSRISVMAPTALGPRRASVRQFAVSAAEHSGDERAMTLTI